jgi:hypothetical protein
MTTETIASTPTRVRTEERSALRVKSISPVPDANDMTGAYILVVVTALMAMTIAVSFWVASSIDY